MSFLLTVTAQEHREIFEDKAQVGPLNPVLRPVTIKDTYTKPRQTNPYFLDFHVIDPIGHIQDSIFQAQVQFEKAGEIIVTSADRPLGIRYALPDGLNFNQQLSLEEAVLVLKTTNNPSGAQKRIEIIDKDHLDTAFFWEIHASPFFYKTEDGLHIEQEYNEERYEPKQGYVSIPIAIIADGQKQYLDIGKPLRFIHKGNEYTAYALESSYLQSADDGGCANGGYIIRIVISKSIVLN